MYFAVRVVFTVVNERYKNNLDAVDDKAVHGLEMWEKAVNGVRVGEMQAELADKVIKLLILVQAIFSHNNKSMEDIRRLHRPLVPTTNCITHRMTRTASKTHH